MTQARQPQRIQNPERIDAGAIRAAIAGGQEVLVQFNTLGERSRCWPTSTPWPPPAARR